MKAFFVAVLLALSLLALNGCQSKNPPPKDAVPSVSSGEEEKKEIEVIGAVREEADFISEEQWALYDKARTYAGCFVQDPGSLGGQEGSSSLITKEIGGYTYRRYTGDTYKSWDDFYKEMRMVFTEDCFQELNAVQIHAEKPKAEIYINVSGELYYLDFNSGGNPTYLKDMDRFVLTLSEETCLKFNQVAYFCDREDVEKEAPAPKSMKEEPVTMVKTEDGWRVSEFSLPR